MARISSATIDEVNSRTDFVALVSEYTRLTRKNSNDYWGCCPFHNEKTESFHIIIDKGYYHCFGCGVGGGIIKFYQEMEKISFVDAVIALAKKAGVNVVYEGNTDYVPQPKDNRKELNTALYTRVAGTFHYFLTKTEAGKPVLQYLLNRGVSQEMIEAFQLGYAPKDRYWLKNFLLKKNYSNDFLNESGLFSNKYPDISFFTNRLMFPISNRNGDVVAFGGRILEGEGPKYINTRELVQYKKSETLYGFHLAKQEIRNKKAVIICEGNMDVIAYHQAGLNYAVAPLGTALTSEQIKLISGFVDTIYLSMDSDGAGEEATFKSIILCRQADLSVRVIELSQGKDPSEILLNYGVDALTNNVEHAKIDFDYLLYKMADKYPVEKPEGKLKAALALFPYIDALRSNIQKESCFEQLAMALGMNLEALKNDYANRNKTEKKYQRQIAEAQESEVRITVNPNAELRAILAVIANMDFFQYMRSNLSIDDFEDAAAKNLYIILEECYREGSVSSDNILAKCGNENLQQLIAQTVMSGEFNGNIEQVKLTIQESIRTVKRNSLERKRNKLMNRIRQFTPKNYAEHQQLIEMLNEKMALDAQLNSK
ncbi:MAG: DNA primase [Treponema sp.]|nr:DNA primase [Treponema sp.]